MFHEEMKALPQWIVAKVEILGDKKRVLPMNARTMRMASSTDSRTWSTFEEAWNAAQTNGGQASGYYLGFVFTKDDPFTGIDLDKPQDDIQRARHTRIYNSIASFTERSLSGNGLHIIVRATIPHALKRDQVEVYDWGRFFIMTGDVVAGRPLEINDCQDIVTKLITEMGGSRPGGYGYEDNSPNAVDTDEAVIQKCADSANGDKFKALYQGHWQQTYGSQSEADYALVNMISFATPNDEQCRRIFRKSHLGQRDKALRDDYMNMMIGRIRKEENPPIDFSQFRPPSLTVTPAPPTTITITTPPPFDTEPPADLLIDVRFPDGLIGEMAQYILDTAIRPIPQVALAGALGLGAGMCGRTYNISHTGLNLYLMLVAGTAIGKEGASQGVTRLVKSVMPKLPAIQQYLGPTEYASGQAMIKQLHQFPCQVSVLSEFGHTLRRICSPVANGADIMWRKVLLDVYNKSGAGDMLGSMVYSDTGKNTPTVYAPALTLLTESSPASLYEGLDEQAIEIGLVPRFLLMECSNTRPPTNPHAFAPPPQYLSDRIEALAHRCLSMEANSTHMEVSIDAKAKKLLHDFDVEVDGYINQHNDDSVRQIWSRAHLKCLRVAGLLAVSQQPDKPVVNTAAVDWARQLVKQDVQNMLARFGEGVGTGDPVQLSKLRHVIVNVLQHGTSKPMRDNNVVQHRLLTQRAYSLACFRQDRRGAGEALKKALSVLIDGGELIQLSPDDTKRHFNLTAKCYMLTESFTLT